MRTPADTSVWEDCFLFVGNELVLDFLNTHLVQDGKPLELLPDFTALLLWFQAAHVLNPQEFSRLQRQWGETPRAQETTESMRDLREDLRKQILAWEHGDGIVVRSARTRRLVCAVSAQCSEIITEVDRKRVRKCDQCVLHFHDTSKKGTRRWCSMQLCGNRLKVAAYVARRRRHEHK